MKKLAFCILHYGQPFLATAVESIVDQVDHIVILYTPSPSQGWGATMPCPDTRQELIESVALWMDKITWVDGSWSNEGDHCDAIHAFQAGYDWIIRFDADEVFQPGTVDEWIKQAEITLAKHFRVPFIHFWRSFDRVCRDAQNPQRMERVNGGDAFAYIDSGDLQGKPEAFSVLHFGYAQPTKYIDYKMQVQGHHAEWRQDWYGDKWLPNAQTDIHPVIFNFWNAEDYDKSKLPEVLKKHPYFEMEIIE